MATWEMQDEDVRNEKEVSDLKSNEEMRMEAERK